MSFKLFFPLFILLALKPAQAALMEPETSPQSAKIRRAISYTAREFYASSELKESIDRVVKRKYKALTTKQQRALLGSFFSVVQVVADKEIKYVWYF